MVVLVVLECALPPGTRPSSVQKTAWGICRNSYSGPKRRQVVEVNVL